MLEAGALVAGTSTGVAAGKGVSDGLNKILNKSAKQTEKAAATGKAEPAAPPTARPTGPEPLLRVGNGVPATEAKPVASTAAAAKKSKAAKKVVRNDQSVKEVPYNVPDPPAAAPKGVKAARRTEPVGPLAPVVYSAPPPPPERVIPSADALLALPAGTSREELLSLGSPSSRVLMDQGGHVVEVYYYSARAASGSGNLLKVRLQDGVVSSVETNP